MNINNTQDKLLLTNQSTERLIFRKLEPSDFNNWLQFCEEQSSLQYIWPGDEKTPFDKCTLWFDKVFYRYKNSLGGMNVIIDKVTNEFIGQCGLLIQKVDGEDELEIGYSLMPKQRGKGYAIEAAKKCRNFAFENNIANSIISIIHPLNIDSAKVAIANGMVLEKQTTYTGVTVNIFRIKKSEWLGCI